MQRSLTFAPGRLWRWWLRRWSTAKWWTNRARWSRSRRPRNKKKGGGGERGKIGGRTKDARLCRERDREEIKRLVSEYYTRCGASFILTTEEILLWTGNFGDVVQLWMFCVFREKLTYQLHYNSFLEKMPQKTCLCLCESNPLTTLYCYTHAVLLITSV